MGTFFVCADQESGISGTFWAGGIELVGSGDVRGAFNTFPDFLYRHLKLS